MTKILIVAIALTMWVTPDGQQPAEFPKGFRLSGPTYFADGKIRGASIGLPGHLILVPAAHTYFQYSGKTLCESSSATTTAPSDAGYGWRVSITPIPPTRATNGVEIEVDWQRRWERGAAVSSPRGRSRVSLQPGDKILLDYIPAGMPAPGCDALGMGLQIELLPVESDSAVVEADLWLIRKSDNGTIERQTIRMQPGEQTPFFFKDVGIALTGEPLKVANAYYFQKESPSMTVRTTGRLTPTAINGERVTATIELSQGIVAIAGQPPKDASKAALAGGLYALMAKRGGASFEFSAAPSEVVEFQVPQLAGAAGRRGEQMAVRVQMRLLGR